MLSSYCSTSALTENQTRIQNALTEYFSSKPNQDKDVEQQSSSATTGLLSDIDTQKKIAVYTQFIDRLFDYPHNSKYTDDKILLNLKHDYRKLLVALASEEDANLELTLANHYVDLHQLCQLLDQYQFDGRRFYIPNDKKSKLMERNQLSIVDFMQRNSFSFGYQFVNTLSGLTIFALIRIWNDEFVLGLNWQTAAIVVVFGSLLTALPFNNYYFAAIDTAKSPKTFKSELSAQQNEFAKLVRLSLNYIPNFTAQDDTPVSQANTQAVSAEIEHHFVALLLMRTDWPPSYRVIMSFFNKLIESWASLSFLFKGTLNPALIFLAGLVLGFVDGLDMAVNKVLNIAEEKRLLDGYARYYKLPLVKSYHSAIKVTQVANHPLLVWVIALVGPSAWVFAKHSAMMRWAETFMLQELLANTQVMSGLSGFLVASIAYASFIFYAYNIKEVLSVELINDRKELFTNLANTIQTYNSVAFLSSAITSVDLAYVTYKLTSIVTEQSLYQYGVAFATFSLVFAGSLISLFSGYHGNWVAQSQANILNFEFAKFIYKQFDQLHYVDNAILFTIFTVIAVSVNFVPNEIKGMELLAFIAGMGAFMTATSLVLPARQGQDRKILQRDFFRYIFGQSTLFFAAAIAAVIELAAPIFYQIGLSHQTSPEEIRPEITISFTLVIGLTALAGMFAGVSEYLAAPVNRTVDEPIESNEVSYVGAGLQSLANVVCNCPSALYARITRYNVVSSDCGHDDYKSFGQALIMSLK